MQGHAAGVTGLTVVYPVLTSRCDERADERTKQKEEDDYRTAWHI